MMVDAKHAMTIGGVTPRVHSVMLQSGGHTAGLYCSKFTLQTLLLDGYELQVIFDMASAALHGLETRLGVTFPGDLKFRPISHTQKDDWTCGAR